MEKRLVNCLEQIAQLPQPNNGRYQKADLLTKDFLLAQDGKLQIYFAPHNLYTERKAKVVIVGICPGWTQTELAFRTYCENLDLELEQRLRACKATSRFAGTMRKNLCQMLDQLHVNNYLGLTASAELFTDKAELVHTTSLIKFPVFKQGRNYSGYGPQILKSKLLRSYVTTYFLTELSVFTQPVLLIPLGKAVEEVLVSLQQEGQLKNCGLLTGFPHPSGVNGHRKEQFAAHYQQLQEQLTAYFVN